MAFDGSGTFNRVRNWVADAAAGVKIRADYHDSEDDNLANGLTNCLTKDGQTQPTANIPMAGKKITNLGTPTVAGDAANKSYVDGRNAFTVPLVLSGAGANGRVRFTGATGPLGIEFVAADLFSGVNATAFVWNDKADATGWNVMELTQTGVLSLQQIGNPTPAIGDTVALLLFRGKNSAAEVVTYSYINAKIDDPINASEDGSLTFGLNVAGVLSTKAVLDATGLSLFGTLTTTGRFLGPFGAGSSPTYSFADDPDTGMFANATPDQLYLTTGGNTRITLSTTAFISSLPVLTLSGTLTAPSHSFNGDSDTGMYRDGADTVSLTAGGVRQARFNAASASFYAPQILGTDGTAALPAQSFTSDTDIGMWRYAANTLGFATAGVNRLRIGISWIINETAQFMTSDGLVGAPSYTFTSDPDTGLYSGGANILGFSTAGVLRLTLSATTAAFTVPVTVAGTLSTTGTLSTIGAFTAGQTSTLNTDPKEGVIALNGTLTSKRAGLATTAHMVFINNALVTPTQVGSIASTATETDYNRTSDELLKDFTGPYDPLAAIDIIRRDPVREYDWKNGSGSGIGWGAQTSYAISHDLASPPPAAEGEPAKAGEPGYSPWGIDLGKRTPYLWAALTWALDQIDALHDRIKTLEGAAA